VPFLFFKKKYDDVGVLEKEGRQEVESQAKVDVGTRYAALMRGEYGTELDERRVRVKE
jgi:hypothetical protein